MDSLERKVASIKSYTSANIRKLLNNTKNMFFSVAQRGMYRPIDVEEEQVAASFRAERVEDCKVHKKICIFAEKSQDYVAEARTNTERGTNAAAKRRSGGFCSTAGASCYGP